MKKLLLGLLFFTVGVASAADLLSKRTVKLHLPVVKKQADGGYQFVDVRSVEKRKVIAAMRKNPGLALARDNKKFLVASIKTIQPKIDQFRRSKDGRDDLFPVDGGYYKVRLRSHWSTLDSSYEGSLNFETFRNGDAVTLICWDQEESKLVPLTYDKKKPFDGLALVNDDEKAKILTPKDKVQRLGFHDIFSIAKYFYDEDYESAKQQYIMDVWKKYEDKQADLVINEKTYKALFLLKKGDTIRPDIVDEQVSDIFIQDGDVIKRYNVLVSILPAHESDIDKLVVSDDVEAKFVGASLFVDDVGKIKVSQAGTGLRTPEDSPAQQKSAKQKLEDAWQALGDDVKHAATIKGYRLEAVLNGNQALVQAPVPGGVFLKVSVAELTKTIQGQREDFITLLKSYKCSQDSDYQDALNVLNGAKKEPAFDALIQRHLPQPAQPTTRTDQEGALEQSDFVTIDCDTVTKKQGGTYIKSGRQKQLKVAKNKLLRRAGYPSYVWGHLGAQASDKWYCLHDVTMKGDRQPKFIMSKHFDAGARHHVQYFWSATENKFVLLNPVTYKSVEYSDAEPDFLSYSNAEVRGWKEDSNKSTAAYYGIKVMTPPKKRSKKPARTTQQIVDDTNQVRSLFLKSAPAVHKAAQSVTASRPERAKGYVLHDKNDNTQGYFWMERQPNVQKVTYDAVANEWHQTHPTTTEKPVTIEHLSPHNLAVVQSPHNKWALARGGVGTVLGVGLLAGALAKSSKHAKLMKKMKRAQRRLGKNDARVAQLLRAAKSAGVSASVQVILGILSGGLGLWQLGAGWRGGTIEVGG